MSRWHGGAAKAAASKPPFSFSEEKAKAPFDGVKRKGLAAAFRTSSGTLAAPITGFWRGGNLRALPIQPNTAVTKVGVPPGCTALLFSLPHPGSLRGPGTVLSIPTGSRQQNRSRGHPEPPRHQSSATSKVRQQKRSRGHTEAPSASEPAYAVEWTQALESAPQ